MLLGINALNHDASVALLDGADVRFAAHAERYSRKKNDSHLNSALINDCLSYGEPTEIVWFEKPWLKASRRFYSGEKPYYHDVTKYLAEHGLGHLPVSYVPHHGAHAAMGFYSSGFKDAIVLVIDAIGEWNSTSIWSADKSGIKKIESVNYPHSMGLFYTAATHAIGLKPNEEEYILMGMAALGVPKHVSLLEDLLFSRFDPPLIKLRHDLHKGMKHIINMDGIKPENFAASVQHIFEDYVMQTCEHIAYTYPNKNLVIVGGSALNCVANGRIRDSQLFDQIFVPANPGDAGLSLGAVAYKQKQHITLDHAYLGHDIRRTVNVNQVIDYLNHDIVVGIANGRAEWGPRALGNRSLLADPRGPDVKDRVNQIKKREPFRPFAPVILEEHAEDYFELNGTRSDFMQYTSICKHPDQFPAIIHVDGTSRVQTVPKNSPSKIREILEAWHERTGCPMLLNTSLNIKGEPLVNTLEDAVRFTARHEVPIF
jgi:carbamoyltransferase